MLSFTAGFLKSQLLTSIPDPTSDFTGQTIIITDSNSGLGLEAARKIVRLGAYKVILAVRTISKGEAAASDIFESCSVDKAVLEVWKLDMADRDSIRVFAKRAEQLDRLDAAVLNAGILTSKFELVNGIETHVAVNVIGTMLLSTLLLPILKRSAHRTGLRSRLTINGSDLMYLAKIEELETDGDIMAKLNDRAKTNISQRYSLSKQLVFYGAQELARRNPLSEESDVIVTVMTPGACQSDLYPRRGRGCFSSGHDRGDENSRKDYGGWKSDSCPCHHP